MKYTKAEHRPSWATASTTIFGLIALASSVITLISWISPDILSWFGSHGKEGWLLVGVSVSIATVCISVLLGRHAKDLAEAESSSFERAKEHQKLRARECAADIKLVKERFGRLMSGGDIRKALADRPHSKLFSKSIAQFFDETEATLDSNSTVIFDHELARLVERMKDGFRAYWGLVSEHLDAPDRLRGTEWELQTMDHSNATWGGETGTHDEFYKRLRSQNAHLKALLEQVDAVEARLYRLHIEV